MSPSVVPGKRLVVTRASVKFVSADATLGGYAGVRQFNAPVTRYTIPLPPVAGVEPVAAAAAIRLTVDVGDSPIVEVLATSAFATNSSIGATIAGYCVSRP